MTGFVAEDGTGKTDSTSYVTVANADTYHADHGAPAAWTAATTATKQAALMAATVYMDYNFKWLGAICEDDQALGWPRDGVVDVEGREVLSDIVPQKVQDACSYLALQHLSTALDSTYARGDDIRRQKVGSLEIEYSPYARPGTWMPYAKQIVADLIKNVGGQVTLTRG